MCSRAKRFGDFSNDERRTKSTGRPINSSASPAISSNSEVETGADSSSVTSRSTSLPGVVNETRLVPFDKALVFYLAIILAAPLLPLLLFVFPLEEMIDRIVALLL